MTQLSAALEFLRLLFRRFIDTRCQQVAASLAFTTLLSLVPLLTVSIVMFSKLPGVSAIGTALKIFLLQNLLPDKAGKIITTYALEFSRNAANLTVIGGVMLVVGAVTLMLTIDRVFNQMWGVRKTRKLAIRLPVYWTALSVGPILMGAGIAAASYLVSASLGMVGQMPVLRMLALRLVPLALFGAFFSFLYFAVPNCKVHGRHALAGGIAAAVALGIMQRLFGMVIAHAPTYTLVYGTFAALPIFLVWLYLSWTIVLSGALIAATLPVFLENRRTTPPFSGHLCHAACAVLLHLFDAQQRGDAVDSVSLFGVASIGSADGEQLLEELREIGWIRRDEDGDWLLATTPDNIRIDAILKHFAFDPAGLPMLPDSPLVHRLDVLWQDALAPAAISLLDLHQQVSAPQA